MYWHLAIKFYDEKCERVDKSALVRRAIELMAKPAGISYKGPDY
jgi:hypothetical protein